MFSLRKCWRPMSYRKRRQRWRLSQITPKPGSAFLHIVAPHIVALNRGRVPLPIVGSLSHQNLWVPVV
jgi:hypothetical protein